VAVVDDGDGFEGAGVEDELHGLASPLNRLG